MGLGVNSLIVQRIIKKADLLMRGDSAHKEIRLALIVGSGTLRGVFGMGALRGFEQSGLSEVFDVVIGVSAGAPNCAYFLSHQTKMAVSVYVDDITDSRFASFLRLKKVVDIDYLERVLRNRKSINVDAVRMNRSEFYVAVTDLYGQGHLINVKEQVDIMLPIKASMAMPIFYNHPVCLDGCSYLDGAVALPMPIKEVCSLFKPTDILVISNYPEEEGLGEISFLEESIARLYLRKFSREFLEAFLARRKIYEESVKLLIPGNDNIFLENINIGMISPLKEYSISRLERNKEKIRSLARIGAQQVFDILNLNIGVDV